MKKTLIMILLLQNPYLVLSQSNWSVDKSHSSVQFEVSHLVISTVVGNFTVFEGKVVSKSDDDLTDADISAEIDVKSVDTRNLSRDDHLRQDDFFNAKKFPKIFFKSKSVKKQSSNNYIVEGELTIRDVTKPIKLEASYGGTVTLEGKKRAGIVASGSLNRFDYHLKWDDTLDNGSMVVGENVDIKLNIQLVKE